jgi:hypothetical protein
MNEEYKLSGQMGAGPIIGPIIAIPLSILGAFIYAYIDVYNPLIYFTGIVWVIYLGSFVLVLEKVARVSKCRNQTTMVIIGLLVGLLSIHISWACFTHAFYVKFAPQSSERPELLALLLDPRSSYNFATTLAEKGWYTIFGYRPFGITLWIIWGIEAGGILLAGLVGGMSALHEKVFCDPCGEWAKNLDYDKRLSLSTLDQNSLQNAIAGEIDPLFDLKLAADGENPHLRLNLNSCPICQFTSTLDFDLITYVQNDEGEVEEKSEDLSPVFVLTEEQFSKFKTIEFPPSKLPEETDGKEGDGKEADGKEGDGKEAAFDHSALD